MAIRIEQKIVGVNIYWVTALLMGAFVGLCSTGGGLINWSLMGFEVVFPFYSAIAVCQWCKIRSDPMFEPIKAQVRSLGRWVLLRFVYVLMVVSVFAAIGILTVCLIKGEEPFLGLFITYLPSAFFLSSLGAALSFLFANEHIATMGCGILWLFSMIAKSLLRFQSFAYFYLFPRFANVGEPTWIINKGVMILLGMAIWLAMIYIIKRR